MTEAEKKLWFRLRLKQLDGYKFRRQFPVGNYIADFVCIESKLIVELDGGQHALRIHHDNARGAFLYKLGYRVLRFWNNEVMEHMDETVNTIYRFLKDPHLTSPLQGVENKYGVLEQA